MIRTLAKSVAATLAVVALGFAPALAETAYPPQPAVGAPKPFQVPQSETYRLANGMTVTLIPYGLAPKAVASLRVFAGNLNEGESTWLADLTAEMLKEGAGGKTGPELAIEAASLGGDLNIGVSPTETSLTLSALSENAAAAVRLIGQVAQQPTFPASEIARLKQDLGRNLAVAQSQPQPTAEAALAKARYGDTPYGRVFPRPEQIAGYDVEDVRRFYAENFGARRARLYIAGKFDEAAVKAAIAEAFEGWASGPDRVTPPAAAKPGPQVVLVDRPGAPQSTLRVVFPAPAYGAEGDIPLRVMNALLGGAFNSRITRNIREEKGYTYSPDSSLRYNPGDGAWVFDADVTTEVTGASLKEVFGEIRKLQTEAAPEDEAAGMRTWMSGVFVLQNASTGGLIGSLATLDVHGLPKTWLDAYVPALLDVSAEDIQATAKARLPLAQMTLVVVGDLKKVEPQLKALPELKGVKFQTVKPFE